MSIAKMKSLDAGVSWDIILLEHSCATPARGDFDETQGGTSATPILFPGDSLLPAFIFLNCTSGSTWSQGKAGLRTLGQTSTPTVQRMLKMCKVHATNISDNYQQGKSSKRDQQDTLLPGCPTFLISLREAKDTYHIRCSPPPILDHAPPPPPPAHKWTIQVSLPTNVPGARRVPARYLPRQRGWNLVGLVLY